MKKIFTSLFLIISFFNATSQSFSNKGTDFWVAYGYHVRMARASSSAINGQDMVLYFATDQVTTITITIPSTGYTQTLVSGPLPTVLTSAAIPKTGTGDVRLTAESTTPENKGIHITSDKPIVAYAHIYDQSVSGATILFPTNTLGKEYYSINYKNISNEDLSNSWFYVVATDTGTTTIEITPSVNTMNLMAGVTTTVNLTQGQVYCVMGQSTSTTGNTFNTEDLTGSKIKSVATGNSSCKRIAVFSGSGKISITCSNTTSSADNYMVQAFPKDAWGKKFLTVPTSSLNHNIYRVCVSDPATVVLLNGLPITNTLTISANNFYYEIPQTTLPQKIEANLPITVAQYIATQGSCGNPTPTNTYPGDPEVIYLSPVEQNIDKVIWNATPNNSITQHYYNVVIPNTGTALSSFKLDGVAVNPASFVVHPQDSRYSYLSARILGSNNGAGVHIIESDSGFNAIAYGYGSAESYGYNAGTNIRPLDFIEPFNPRNISHENVACSGSSVYLTLNLPFQPTSLFWDFHNSPYQTPNTNVNVPDASTIFESTYFIGGQQFWRYKLPTLYNFSLINPNSDSSIYQISITAGTTSTEGCGNTYNRDFPLTIYRPAPANFTFLNNGCINDPAVFTDVTVYTNGTYSYLWDWTFDDGSAPNSTDHNPTHLFTTPGVHNVKFTLVTNVGCQSDTTIAVTVNPLPTATATGTSPVCQNSTANPTVTFTATAGTSPYTFNYTINGGALQSVVTTGTSNTTTISVPTTTAGVFNYNVVSLQGATCLQTQNISPVAITINPLPTATISGSTTVCQNATSPVITFTGSGATAPYTFTYNLNGGATQTITTTSGNSVTILVPTNIVGTFTYNLLDVTDGTATACNQIQSGTAVVIVKSLPTATISGATALCLNATAPDIEFIGANGTAPYTFTYNINGGPNLTVTTTTGNSVWVTVPTSVAGTFNYQLVSVSESSANLCSQSQTGTVSVIVYQLPTPNFNVNLPTCANQSIQFNDLSVPNAGTTTQWHWDFGDGTAVETIANPTHVYSATGSYQVSLYVTTNNGCQSAVFPRTLTLNPSPVAGFINPEVCLDFTQAVFLDTSNIAAVGGASITQWLWNFGDPASGALNTSTSNPAQHSYNSIGTKNVTLTVTSNLGCVSTVTQSFFVNGSNPVANATLQNTGNLCANEQVSIKDNSTVLPGSIVKVEITWDFNGAPSVVEIDDNPYFGKIYNHLYPNFQSPLTKTFRIKFRAYSGQTCLNDTYLDVTINAAPKVQFNDFRDTCMYITPFQITQATEIGGVPGTYLYTGLGVSPTGLFNPALVGPGSYLIKYNYTSTFGCKDSAEKPIVILPPPVAVFGYSSPLCEGSVVTFTDTSTAIAGPIATWTWNFGDGSAPLITNNNNPVTHIFPLAQPFLVKLRVTTAGGCNSANRVIEVDVKPKPLARFDFSDTACLPNAKILFNNTSTIADGTTNAMSYTWNFGEPSTGLLNTSTSINPTHYYQNLGPYLVKLLVRSNVGCIDDTIITINTIHPRPDADFSFSKPSVCIGDNIQMFDISNTQDGTLLNWYWDFGDGGNDIIRNPVHTFADTGLYLISHYIKNSFGCMSDTMIKPLNIYPYPQISAGPDIRILEGLSGALEATAVGTNLEYLWASSTFLNNPLVLNPVCTPTRDIHYLLTVKGIGGCSSTDDVNVILLKSPLIPNTFSPNGDGINDLWKIEYLNQYPNARVQVFARTGQLVFESKNGYLKAWDGTYNGKPLLVDTYYYIIEPASGRDPITGYITILK